MQPPCEIMVEDFLPNMRGIVSHELRKKGESQAKIASLLGITQARVSFYLAKKKSFFQEALTLKFGITDSDSESFGKILAEDVMRSRTDAIFTIYSLWKNLLFTGSVCPVHQEESGVPIDCSVCMELHKPVLDTKSISPDERGDTFILREISEAAKILEDSPYFPQVMPEVSVNIAMSREDPKTSRDVAAVPGRINKIHGRAKSFVLPEFGCSNHMSRVLLIAYTRNKEMRAGLNIKFDSRIERILAELRIPRKTTEDLKSSKSPRKYDQTPAKSPDERIIEKIAQTNFPSTLAGQAFALIDRGSEGLEPITYLLGRKATDIAKIAINLAHKFSNVQTNELEGAK